jgi:hypothetical protein
MAMALARNRRASRRHVPVLDEELGHGTGVVPLRLERFDVRLAGGGEHLAVRGPAVPVLVGEACRGKERPAASTIPEHARTRDRSFVTWQIRPRIVVHVGRLLPVTATQQ